jgi:cobalt-zinc-cadmium efflux system membrane fusion protein
MTKILRTVLALSVCGVVGMRCAAKAPDEPEKKLRGQSGRVWLSKQQIADAKLAITSVEQRAIGETVMTSGRVAFDDLRVSHVFSPVTGRVTKILAQPGTRVKKGQPLAILESPDLGQAFADLAKAQADLVAAQRDYNRQKELYEAHAGAQKDFELAEDNYHKAVAELERAKRKARLLRSDSADQVTQEYTLRSPIDGEVIARNINPAIEIQGQYSGGNAPELFTIGELDRVLVYADLFDQDLARVQEGSKAMIRVAAYPNRTFDALVEWVSDALDPATRTAKVRCAVDNPDHALKPEMYASVTMSAPSKMAVAIPRSAVLKLGEQTVVFVQSGQELDGRTRFERRLVDVDEDQSDEYIPVIKGLEAGEQIVSSGAILLSETAS